jgi:hypothetical protein
MRRLVLFVLVIGLIGTGLELALLDHFEDSLQVLPVALIAAAGASLVWLLVRPGRAIVRVFQGVMVAFVLAGALGVLLHYRGNLAFQQEIDPEQRRSEMFWNALHAKSPPALAPGVMVQLGLLGLIFGYRHPAAAGTTEGNVSSPEAMT